MAHFNPMLVWTKDFYEEVVFLKACKSFLLTNEQSDFHRFGELST